MGRNVSGNAMFVRVSDAIYPIFCTAPTDSHERDILNDPHSSYEDRLYARRALDREEQDVRTVWQKCDTVFQSIHVKNSIRKTAGDSSGPGPQAPAEATPSGTEVAGSLADVAKRVHQAPGPAAVASSSSPSPLAAEAENAVPAGYKVHAFNYCRSATQCWNASVIVPSAAQLVSSACRQYIFETKVQGTPLMLLAGASGSDRCDGRSANDPNLVHWNALVDPESKRAPGTFVTITSLQVKLDGQPAVITTMGFKRGMADWMGKRAEIDANGVQLVVGCMAPRDHFADGEDVCSALIESLRLP